MKELQKSINEWTVNTFGDGTALSQALRANIELGELIIALANGKIEEAKKEIADVEILILDTAELLKVDLEKAVNDKMKINRSRKQIQLPNGRWQHEPKPEVETPKISYCPECQKLLFPMELYESIQAGKFKVTHIETCISCLNLIEADDDKI